MSDVQQVGLWTSVCATCEKELPLENFYVDRGVYVHKSCKACELEKHKRRTLKRQREQQEQEPPIPALEYELHKVCVVCGKEKAATAFRWIYFRNKAGGNRKRYEECEECENIIIKTRADFKRELAERERTEASLALDWVDRIKAKHRKGYDQHLKVHFGKTIEEYGAMVQAQEGKCAICRKNPTLFNERLFVDHSHVTGSVRGLLCQACNFGLGWFQDNRESLHRASEYLQRWNTWSEET